MYISYKNIGGKKYISDIDVEKLMLKHGKNDWVFSPRLSNTDWHDETGSYCLLSRIDIDNDRIAESQKVYCVGIGGYDYIDKKEFELKIKPILS